MLVKIITPFYKEGRIYSLPNAIERILNDSPDYYATGIDRDVQKLKSVQRMFSNLVTIMAEKKLLNESELSSVLNEDIKIIEE